MAVAVVKDTTPQDEAPLALGLLGCDSSSFKMFQDVSSTSEFYDIRTHYGESMSIPSPGSYETPHRRHGLGGYLHRFETFWDHTMVMFRQIPHVCPVLSYVLWIFLG
jgi:hypothetical protein